MRVRCGFFALLATAVLMLTGCGKTDNTPPPGTDTDTPTVDIDEGNIVSPDEIAPNNDATDTEAAKPGE